MHLKLLEQGLCLLEQRARVSHATPTTLGECQLPLREQRACQLWHGTFASCHGLRSAEMSLRLRQFDENLALRWALMKHLREMPRCDLVLMLVESLSCALPEHPDLRRITTCV